MHKSSVKTSYARKIGDTSPMKTVVFLGAGASKADGAPLQSDIFHEYFTNDYFRKSHRDMDRELATFFYCMFGIDVDNARPGGTAIFPTFEEAIGILDIAAARGESFKNFDGLTSALNSNRIGHMRNHLVMLLAKIIEIKLRRGNYYHTMLVNNLLPYANDVAFVSTNYDILIDKAIFASTGMCADYGVNFDNIENMHSNCKDISQMQLYKLHGSLNWLYCPVCNGLSITVDRKGALDVIDNPSEAQCRICDEQKVPIIVPPTYFKSMNNIYLSTVWNRAENVLKNAEHIVFCGYSFPDADIHIKYLLKRIETNRKDGAGLRISLVNGFRDKKTAQANLERLRYTRFFTHKVVDTGRSFQEFSKSPEDILRP